MLTYVRLLPALFEIAVIPSAKLMAKTLEVPAGEHAWPLGRLAAKPTMPSDVVTGCTLIRSAMPPLDARSKYQPMGCEDVAEMPALKSVLAVSLLRVIGKDTDDGRVDAV